MIHFKGLGTALVTPFRDGKVDRDAYRKLVKRQVEAGVDFLVPLGSTAETPCLSDDEKAAIMSITREEACGLPVIAGAGTNSLTGTLHNISLLDRYGADAYLIVVPYYNKPTQEGLYEYFKAVAEHTDRQIILYNVPSRTGTNMTAATTIRLAGIPNITAVKEASGDIDQILEIRRMTPSGFSVLSGNDDQTLPLMAGGADGVISVASNIAPEAMKSLTEYIAAQDLANARSVNNALMPLYHACFVESNPIPVKAALSLMGLCTDDMRLPLTKAADNTKAILTRVLGELKLI